ncbi:MAG TPA: hypothetical protein VKK79_23520 [Candidatus Lokiarchaeia archaeon]|nr:hypothetical protein [Candidatus Lokiarchaeia archaeon]
MSIQKAIKPKKRIGSAQEQGPKTAGVSEFADKSSVGNGQQRQSMLDIIEKGNAALETNALEEALAYLSEATNIADEISDPTAPDLHAKIIEIKGVLSRQDAENAGE